MTYYLKYRSQTLNELDLTSVRESLIKIVRSKKIPHAFLFSGPKGTGKTSAARIIAKIINCESTSVRLRGQGKISPCNRCLQCQSITKGTNLDVIELDAASHRGIDDVRSLREAVKLTPAKAKTKVYVIDEAHMLTTEASNALLKTLEEPPEHVMFILATTNPEKLIETIRSRTTNIVFSKANENEILQSLKRIKKGEKLKINDTSLRLIARASEGSFRDAAKILEQLVSEVKVLNSKNVAKFIKKSSIESDENLFKLLSERKTKELLSWIEKNIEAGVDAKLLGEEIVEKLRQSLRAKFEIGEDKIGLFDQDELISLIETFQKAVAEIATSFIEHLPLELAVIKWCEKKMDKEKEVGEGGNSQKKKRDEKEKMVVRVEDGDSGKGALRNTQDDKKESSKKSAGSMTDNVWSNILGEIKPKNSKTEALLRAAKPFGYDGHTLTLGVFYSFHKEQLESILHRRILEDVCSQILGNKVNVICKLTKPPEKEVKSGKSESVVLTEPSQSNDFDSLSSEMPLTEEDDEDIIKVAKEIFGS